MAKKVKSYIKLQVPAGQANPSPPVGPALGQHGVNIMEFCKAFNASTQSMEAGMPIPVIITVYSDRSFTFCDQDSAGRCAAAQGRQDCQGQRRAEYAQGWNRHPLAAGRNCQAQGAGSDGRGY